MNKLSILIPTALVSLTLLVTSCGHEDLDKSYQKNDSLMTVIKENESTINNYISSFNEVEVSLDSITAKQQIISLNTDKSHGELKAGQKDRINSEIAAINEMMEQNRQTIATLNTKLQKSANKNVVLEKTIATLNRQLMQKYNELINLNDQLEQVNIQAARLRIAVDTLSNQNMAQTQTIAEKNDALHTAYYVVGKSKDLQNAKVINKQGGLLGIGRTSIMSTNFDNSKFTRIDYTKTLNISINSTAAKLITNHPSDSYMLNKDIKDGKFITDLAITNPEKFWSVSKYLVIVSN